ncbi:hypothetical protein ISCGN_029992 [Ixodes scapularis]
MKAIVIRTLQILALIALVSAVTGAAIQDQTKTAESRADGTPHNLNDFSRETLQVRFTNLSAASLVREKAKAPKSMKAIVIRALQILALIALVSAVTGAAIQDQTETAEWRADDTARTSGDFMGLREPLGFMGGRCCCCRSGQVAASETGVGGGG